MHSDLAMVFACRKVLEDYSTAMSKLCLEILEVLGLSLGVGRSTFRDFYADNESIFRVNYYPPCPKPDLTLGTGPHHDPTSLTILHQDDISGLQVCVNGKWYTVSPKPNTFVVNIGDTFMVRFKPQPNQQSKRALTNPLHTHGCAHTRVRTHIKKEKEKRKINPIYIFMFSG